MNILRLEDFDYRLLENGDYRVLESGTTLISFPLGFGARKKLGRPGWSDPLGVYGIWQMRMTKRGKVPIKMRFYTPTNPQTVPQQANRQKFADAMAAWVALTAGEREAYNVRAKRVGRFGWGVFIGEYYKTH